jgi:hypothetical protein
VEGVNVVFRSEEWTRDLWIEWAFMLLLAMQWDGAQRTMPPESYEWDEFRAEWFRALFYDGKDAGFTTFEKR